MPYPSRVPGTEMWAKARDAESASSAAPAPSASSTPASRGRGRGGRAGYAKRRALEQPEAQPTPKRATRSFCADLQLYSPAPLPAPAPAKGLLASAAEIEEAQAELTQPEEDSVPASPEPPALPNDSFNSALAKSQEAMSARERSPPLPRHIGDPDDHGVRIYHQKPSQKDKGVNSRIFAPCARRYEDWEVGFRDSTNDSSKGHSRAKRGKYLDTPNSNGVYYDHWCSGYDYSSLSAADLDQDLVKLHGLHPRYGIFLPGGCNNAVRKQPAVMPGKPVAYIANPSGRVSHASRGFQRTDNHRLAEDAPWQGKIRASLLRFCKMDRVALSDVSVDDLIPSDEELISRSLGLARKSLLSAVSPRKPESPDTGKATLVGDSAEPSDSSKPQLSMLTYAAAYVEASDAPRPTPRPAKQARYDAIRDVFTDSSPTTAPAPEAGNVALKFLAELCNIENRRPGVPEAIVSYKPAAVPEHHAEPQPAPTPQRARHPESFRPEPRASHTQPESHWRVPYPSEAEHAAPSAYGPMYGYAALGRPERGQNPIYGSQPTTHGLAHPAPVAQSPGGTRQYRPLHEPVAPHPMPGQSQRAVAHGPPVLEYGGYLQLGGYAPHDARDAQASAGRPVDLGIPPRRSTGYGQDAPPPYPASIWSQHGPSGPPGPSPSMAQAAPPQPPTRQLYSPRRRPPSPQQSRFQFSYHGGAEPLPPLRPPRAVSGQPMFDERPGSSMRHGSRGSTAGYFTIPTSRSYGQAPSVPESHAPIQPMTGERMLPNPQPLSETFAASPRQGYLSHLMSPTYGAPALSAQAAQSPPGTPHGPPGSAYHHRPTHSGSSDAGFNKYRKLQPAPIPAHRAGWSKQELKTIPYDVKEMGSSAALPSSGPTQIRGWSVNQTRKRGKSDKHDRADSVNERDDLR